jgi:3D (Asp-Asp-Asp) domain-containing protein
VLGQAHTPRRRVLPFAAIALAVLVAPAVSGANPTHSSVPSLRARDAAIAAKSRAAVLGLYSLDSQLAQARERLASLYARAHSLRAQRAILQQQLVVARRSTRIGEQQLAQRVRQLYENGPVEPLEIMLGAKSLDQAMTSIDSLSRASAQSEDVLAQLKSARHNSAAAAHALATRESALAAETRAAEATASTLESARTQRAQYVASLASDRRLTQQQIGALVARAQSAQIRSSQLTSARASEDSMRDTVTPPAPVFVDTTPGAGRTLTVSATGYALSGTTATGLPVGWGIVAVDPSVIPLGTHMTVPGYGEAVAADTGGAIVGDTIDLWFPTVAQADAWGRRTVTITLH